MSAASRVYIETGHKRVFACSLEWPGLSRSAKTEEVALATLALTSRGTRRWRPEPASP